MFDSAAGIVWLLSLCIHTGPGPQDVVRYDGLHSMEFTSRSDCVAKMAELGPKVKYPLTLECQPADKL